MLKGITKRWLLNSLSLVLVILLITVIAFSFFIKNYYYSVIQQTLSGRANELVNVFAEYTSLNSKEFEDESRAYVENFPDKELMELMIFNNEGKIIITSVGFEPDMSQPMPDYTKAKSSSDGFAMWIGNLTSNEEIMAITRVIHNKSTGEFAGAVRYVVSLEAANRRIFLLNAAIMTAAIIIIFFVIVSGTYFIRSIINPVKEISAAAKKIAQGNFNAKLQKKNNDEIGDLCDAINYMADELNAAEQVKNDFISSVSHELRTPLTAIKGWAETMQMSGTLDPAMTEKGMEIIIKEAGRLTGLVEELLDFSRIQSGKMILIVDKVDILAELDEAVYMLRERAISENKHLVFDEPENIIIVKGDKNRLRQVFMNIIDNALKYTESDGLVEVQAEEADGYITITISDNGCGIPAEDLPKVKEKFYKSNQTKRGSGIGLAVADEIVRLHGGTLGIESAENVGTVVFIKLPTYHEVENQNEPKESGQLTDIVPHENTAEQSVGQIINDADKEKNKDIREDDI